MRTYAADIIAQVSVCSNDRYLACFAEPCLGTLVPTTVSNAGARLKRTLPALPVWAQPINIILTISDL